MKGRIRQWKITSSNRKLAYQNIRNRKASKIYLEWSKREIPIIPRIYFPKQIDNEPDNQKHFRKKLASGKLTTKSEILNLHSKQYEHKYRKVYDEML